MKLYKDKENTVATISSRHFYLVISSISASEREAVPRVRRVRDPVPYRALWSASQGAGRRVHLPRRGYP